MVSVEQQMLSLKEENAKLRLQVLSLKRDLEEKVEEVKTKDVEIETVLHGKDADVDKVLTRRMGALDLEAKRTRLAILKRIEEDLA